MNVKFDNPIARNLYAACQGPGGHSGFNLRFHWQNWISEPPIATEGVEWNYIGGYLAGSVCSNQKLAILLLGSRRCGATGARGEDRKVARCGLGCSSLAEKTSPRPPTASTSRKLSHSVFELLQFSANRNLEYLRVEATW